MDFFPANVDLKYADLFTSSKVWGVAVEPAEQWPLDTTAGNTKRERVFLGKRKLHHGNLSLSLSIKFSWKSKVGKVFPSFYLHNGGQSSPWQKWLSIQTAINPQTPHESKIIHSKLSASLLREKTLKKAKLKMKHSKNTASVWFAQPSLLNIPLPWQDLHGKCIWRCPGSVTRPWQMMDGPNPAAGIQNKVQEGRGWVAEGMNRPSEQKAAAPLPSPKG